MSKTRNLKYQFMNCIEKNFKEGINKHSLKQSGKRGDEVFSYSQRKNLIDLSSNFSNWMKTTHNEIKQVKDVTPQHVQEFLNSKRMECSQATLEQYQSQFNKLENLVNSTYKTNVNYHTSKILSTKNGGGKLRTDMLSTSDYNKLMQSTNKNFTNALSLSQNFGLRASECSKLKGSDFKTDGLHIVDSKGKRSRIIPYETRNQMKLKEKFENMQRICSCKTASLQQAFNREKKKNNINSASDFHASRKAYATERFENYRKQGLSVQQSLNKVSSNLGHSGDGSRNDLMKEYICCAIQ